MPGKMTSGNDERSIRVREVAGSNPVAPIFAATRQESEQVSGRTMEEVTRNLEHRQAHSSPVASPAVYCSTDLLINP
jgi:hypothetical protein